MKYAAICSTIAVFALAGCATAPTDTPPAPPPADMAPPQPVDNQPATDRANSPGSGMINSGGGLSQHMTVREAVMAFQNLDANKDGFVDKSEFTHYGDSGQRFSGCDTDRDGKLTQAEYVACSQRPASAGH